MTADTITMPIIASAGQMRQLRYVALAQELEAKWLTYDDRAHERLAETGLSVDLGSGLPPDWAGHTQG